MHKECNHNPISERTYIRTVFWYIKKTSAYTRKQMSDVAVCAICGQEIRRPIEYYPCMYISFALLSIITCASIEMITNIDISPIIMAILLLVLERVLLIILMDIPSAIILAFGKWRTLPPYLARSIRRTELLRREGYARLWKAALSFIVGGVIGALLFFI